MSIASMATPDHAAASVSADAVFRIVYRSRSRIEPARSGLALSDILGVARNKNTALGITGALMLYQDWFAQVLEGAEARVRALFAPTRSDGRHGSAQVTEPFGGVCAAPSHAGRWPTWASATSQTCRRWPHPRARPRLLPGG